MPTPTRRARPTALLAAALLLPLSALVGVTAPAQGAATPAVLPADTPLPPGPDKGRAGEDEEEGEEFVKLRDAYYETRLLSGDEPLTIEKASELRGKAADAAVKLRATRGSGTTDPAGSYDGAWRQVGPDPTLQIGRTSGTLENVTGRIAALAIRKSAPRTVYLGAAQGGVWTYDPASKRWSPLTDNLPTLSVGDLAIAPSNEDVLYLATGEGALSGDSYFGDGVWRSADAGRTWSHVSGTRFTGVSSSRVVVDPANADHLFLATLRGRGGIRRTTPPTGATFGVYESRDGGVSWVLRKGTTDQFRGATDLELDPLSPTTLWASFWGDAIYKSTDSGATWARAMTGLPADGLYADGGTRFSLDVTHLAGQQPVLYTGFGWFNGAGKEQKPRLFKSTDGAATWSELPTGSGQDSVLDYCATQCSYDNVIESDPANPDVVFAGGQYDYGRGSGGIYRSLDGGQTWKSVGYDLHPDYHALAFDPADPEHVVVGNDGGVWQSADLGGRRGSEPLSAATWEDLNSGGLQITQFTSIANVPQVPARVWGGTQDNGTQRKSAVSNTWFDVAGGDGGQVLVDPTNPNFVFGTFYGISPYRFSNGGGQFYSQSSITGGINRADRAEFYVPWVMNQANPDQLFLGTYRLYRTNNARTAKPGDVRWTPISGDLTSGCPGTAPNGARGCFISAVGLSDGGTGLYTGSDDGYVYASPNAVTAATPTWKRVDKGALPARPVSQFAVDRSDWRTAYVSYAGFSAATPTKPGHVFKTDNGGQSWKNISGNLPEAPVNSLLLDPSYPNTLYAGTDVGAFVTRDGGATWQSLGTGMPRVAVWQLAQDPRNRNLRAGTHGRGAFSVSDKLAVPALVETTTAGDAPVGPGSDLTYTINVRNIGNADATGVSISDLIPVGTSFVSASDGGTLAKGRAVWSGLSVPKQGSRSVTLTVRIAPDLPSTVTAIDNDKVDVTAAGGFGTHSSPQSTPIAPRNAVTVAPAAAIDGARVGQSVDYPVSLRNRGYTADSYAVSASGGYGGTVLDATCTTPVTTTATVAPGATLGVCVRVPVPAGAANEARATTTFTATSTSDATATGSSALTAVAVAVDTLLVDNDGNGPDVAKYYKDALAAAGTAYSYWDLGTDSNLPSNYLKAHRNVVWFTGNSYPGPILPYESRLASFLDGGGRLLLSGQDLLDGSAGTSAFVKTYLHVNWDGTEAQNDKRTEGVSGVAGNPVTDGIGRVPLDLSVLGSGNVFMDRITPVAPATSAFTDDSGAPDALTVADGAYKVVFLAYPLEEYGSATQKADLVQRSLAWFGS